MDKSMKAFFFKVKSMAESEFSMQMEIGRCITTTKDNKAKSYTAFSLSSRNCSSWMALMELGMEKLRYIQNS